MTILAGILLIVIASFVLAYFAARTWHWAYVLVVVGIVISSAGFFILSAEVLRINGALRSEYNKAQAELNRRNARIVALKRGTTDSQMINELRGLDLKVPEDAPSILSVNDMDHLIRMQTQVRGPMWKNVTPTGYDPQTGAVRIGIDAPTPPGIVANTVVYVFEAGQPALPDPRSGKQYIGEFRVVEASGQTAVLLPALEMSEYQQQRLANSGAPWVMYETMPPDRHEVFAGMNEEQLRQRIPQGSVEEYIRHGQPTVPDDDVFRQTGVDETGKRLGPDDLDRATQKVYQRRLRDYAQEFRKLAQRRAVLLTDKMGLEVDNTRLAEALASAQRLSAFRQDEIGKLNTDLAGLAKDRQALARFTERVGQQLDTLRTMLDQTLQQNNQLLQELAARQAAVANTINQAASAESPNPLTVGRAE
ncbi:MAG: hypothetical protein WD669_08035 [Pirellulales bacterium]